MARPPKPINWELVEKQMEAKCDAKEIAGYFRIDVSNFYDRFLKEYGKSFTTIATEMHSAGNANLKYRQYAKAMEGNTQMMIFLGKQKNWLGQKEHSENTDLPPNNTQIDANLVSLHTQKVSSDADEPQTNS